MRQNSVTRYTEYLTDVVCDPTVSSENLVNAAQRLASIIRMDGERIHHATVFGAYTGLAVRGEKAGYPGELVQAARSILPQVQRAEDREFAVG